VELADSVSRDWWTVTGVIKMGEKYHRAARDGCLDALREATRKDCNAKDEDGMSPTLWAAFQGNLDALRLVVGRGGDPAKCDNYGNTALHLAAAKGRLNCVTFLVNYGINLWDLDIDLHSAKDLAAINKHEDILKYLHTAATQLEALNPKLARTCQEKAKKEAEKRVKTFQKIQKKAEKIASKESQAIEKKREMIHSTSTIKNNAYGAGPFSSLTVQRDTKDGNGTQPRYSELLGGTVRSRKLLGGVFSKIQKKHGQGQDDDFVVREGRGTVRSLSGLRSGQVPEILFMDKESSRENGNGARTSHNSLRAVFGAQHSEPPSIFNRPSLGSVAFRNSISAFNSLNMTGEVSEVCGTGSETNDDTP